MDSKYGCLSSGYVDIDPRKQIYHIVWQEMGILFKMIQMISFGFTLNKYSDKCCATVIANTCGWMSYYISFHFTYVYKIYIA